MKMNFYLASSSSLPSLSVIEAKSFPLSCFINSASCSKVNPSTWMEVNEVGDFWLPSPASPSCGCPTQSQGLPVFFPHHSSTFGRSSPSVDCPFSPSQVARCQLDHLLQTGHVRFVPGAKFKTFSTCSNLSKMVVSSFLIRPISAAAPALP